MSDQSYTGNWDLDHAEDDDASLDAWPADVGGDWPEADDDDFEPADDDGLFAPEVFDAFLDNSDSFEEAVSAYTEWEAKARESVGAQQDDDAEDAAEQAVAELLRDNPHIAADIDGFRPYLQHAVENGGTVADAVELYDAWLDELTEAQRTENVNQPKTYDDAFRQAFDEGLIGGKRKAAGSGDAYDEFGEALRLRNDVKSRARRVVREGRRR